MANGKAGVCPLCGYIGKLTVHHSVWPRRDVPAKIRKEYTLLICRDCHDVLHIFIEPRFSIRRYYRFIINKESEDDDGVA